MKAIDTIRTALEMNDFDTRLLEDMRDAPLTQPTDRQGNHPLWVAGHLALTEAMFRQMMTGKSNPLEDWKPLFDAGTEPVADANIYPKFEMVLSEFKKQRAHNMELLEELGDAGLAEPLKAPPQELPPDAELFFRTIGTAFITLSNHQAFHCGQVADARRAAGRKPIFM